MLVLLSPLVSRRGVFFVAANPRWWPIWKINAKNTSTMLDTHKCGVYSDCGRQSRRPRKKESKMKIYSITTDLDLPDAQTVGDYQHARATRAEAEADAADANRDACHGRDGGQTLLAAYDSEAYVVEYDYTVRLGDAGEHGGEDGERCIEYVGHDGRLGDVEWVDDYELSRDSSRQSNGRDFLDGAPDCVIDAFEARAKAMLAKRCHDDKECVFGFCEYCSGDLGSVSEVELSADAMQAYVTIDVGDGRSVGIIAGIPPQHRGDARKGTYYQAEAWWGHASDHDAHPEWTTPPMHIVDAAVAAYEAAIRDQG